MMATLNCAESRRRIALLAETFREFLFGKLLQVSLGLEIGIEDPIAIFGEGGAMGAIAVEQLGAERCFGLLHDAPCLAVGHVHALRSCIQRAHLANAHAQVGNSGAKLRIAVGFCANDRQADDGFQFELCHVPLAFDAGHYIQK